MVSREANLAAQTTAIIITTIRDYTRLLFLLNCSTTNHVPVGLRHRVPPLTRAGTEERDTKRQKQRVRQRERYTPAAAAAAPAAKTAAAVEPETAAVAVDAAAVAGGDEEEAADEPDGVDGDAADGGATGEGAGGQHEEAEKAEAESAGDGENVPDGDVGEGGTDIGVQQDLEEVKEEAGHGENGPATRDEDEAAEEMAAEGAAANSAEESGQKVEI